MKTNAEFSPGRAQPLTHHQKKITSLTIGVFLGMLKDYKLTDQQILNCLKPELITDMLRIINTGATGKN